MKIKDLPEPERKTMRAIIRGYCTLNKLYAKAHQKGIGPEQTEETMERLIDSGHLEIVFDNVEQKYHIRPRGIE